MAAKNGRFGTRFSYFHVADISVKRSMLENPNAGRAEQVTLKLEGQPWLSGLTTW